MNNEFVLADSLGRIQGTGRFNNHNSVIVNSHRIFLPEHLRDMDIQPTSSNRYLIDTNEVNPLKDSSNLISQKKYSSNLTNISPPQSFDSIKHKFMNPNYQGKNILSSATKPNHAQTIEKLFYGRIDKTNPFSQNAKFDNGYNNYKQPNLFDNNNTNEYKSNKMYSSHTPDVNYSYSFQKHIPKSCDFHSIYNTNENKAYLKPSMSIAPNNILKNTNNYIVVEKKDFSQPTYLDFYTLSDLEQPKKRFDDEVMEEIANIQRLNPDQYTVLDAMSVVEYSYKRHWNVVHNTSICESIKVIDRFDTDPYQGLFCLFSGIGEANKVVEYCQDKFPELFHRSLRYNPKRMLPYKPQNDSSSEMSEFSLRNEIKLRRKGVKTTTETLLLNTYLKLDDDLKYMKCLNTGCTAVTAFITQEEETITGFVQNHRVLYIANLGDVRCLLITSGGAKRLSTLHTVNNDDELKRINTSGGVIYNKKVYGQTEITRALGVMNLKQYGVTAVPDVTKLYLNELDRYLVIGNSGIFEALSEGDVIYLCNSSNSTETIVANIIKNASLRSHKSNLSCLVIKL